MRRSVALVAGIAVVATVLLLRVSSSDPVPLWRDASRDAAPTQPVEEADTGQASHPAPPPYRLGNPQLNKRESRTAYDDLGVIALVVLVVAALAWLSRRRWRPLTGERRERVEPFADIPAELADTTARLDAVLSEGEPRNAIVRCWVELEKAVEAAGLPRDPSETPRELTTRVIGNYVVDRHAIDVLAELYREARFSNHALEERDRSAARTALAELTRQLHAPVVGAAP